MTNIYVLETSPKDASLSAELAQTFIAAFQETDKSATVTTRRLRDTALLSLEEGDISALRTQDGATTAQQEQAIALSDELITELEAADMVVIAAPFHNFTMTALMRQWLDYVVRPGKSFGYSADGPKGLLQDKPVVILSTRGGNYRPSAQDSLHPADFQTGYLRHIFGFMGLRSLSFIAANGMDMGPEAREAGLTEAKAEIENVVAALSHHLAPAA